MKVAVINCYFGKFPSYFQLWLDSCGKNENYDFLIFTDANIESYRVAKNTRFIKMTWTELVKKIESKFDFDVQIESPYKLTDFKVAYGFIFSDFLNGYDYWGYCDVDLLFGNLDKYIAPRIEEGYEKIYRLGHLTLLKNNKKLTYLFTQGGSPFSYKDVFTHKQFYSFDEHVGLMSISRKNAIKEYYCEEMADISCRVSNLTVARNRNYQYQVFYYENGSVYRSFVDVDGEVKTEEFVYIHLQKRKMDILTTYNNFFIVNHAFIDKKKPGEPEKEEIIQLATMQDDNHKQELRLYYCKKMKEFLSASLREKQIWIKQKQAEKTFIEK